MIYNILSYSIGCLSNLQIVSMMRFIYLTNIKFWGSRIISEKDPQ